MKYTRLDDVPLMFLLSLQGSMKFIYTKADSILTISGFYTM